MEFTALMFLLICELFSVYLTLLSEKYLILSALPCEIHACFSFFYLKNLVSAIISGIIAFVVILCYIYLFFLRANKK